MKIKFLLLFLFINTYAMEIYPEVSAKIIKIKSTGDKFMKGDILVELDSRQVKLELQYLQVIKKSYQQSLEDKQLIFKEKQELFDRLVGSRRDLKQARLDFEKAQREFDAHNIVIKIAQIELEKYRILAPFNGTIEIVNPKNATNINNDNILIKVKKQENGL